MLEFPTDLLHSLAHDFVAALVALAAVDAFAAQRHDVVPKLQHQAKLCDVDLLKALLAHDVMILQQALSVL